MTKRRHCPPFDEFDTTMARRPVGKPLPAEFRAPAEPARERSERFLADRAQPGFGAQMIHQDDFAARPDDTGKLIERGLGVGHRCDHILRYHHIEGGLGKCEMLRIHHREAVNVAEPAFRNARFGFTQHWRRKIDPDEPVRRGIIRQREPSANADFKDPATDALRRGSRRFAAAFEHRTEDEVVDRRPARIGFRDGRFVELVGHKLVGWLALERDRERQAARI